MPHSGIRVVGSILLLAVGFAVVLRATGQGPGGGGGMPHPGGPGIGPGGAAAGLSYAPRGATHGNTAPNALPDSAGSLNGMHGGLQGPPGRWWDDKHYAKELKLRPDQQHRMDAIFEANKPLLLLRLATVQQEEMRMEALTRVNNPEEGQLYAQIDRLWRARAELEKTKTHFLLQIRQEMDAEQQAKLMDTR